MYHTLRERFRQGHRTFSYPDGPPPPLPERFLGRPKLDTINCPLGCQECQRVCPMGAIVREGSTFRVDLGKCLFCSDCLKVCPKDSLTFTKDHRLSARNREDLVMDVGIERKKCLALDKKMLSLFGRSLKLRQVSAGGCNACESDVNVLGTPAWDLGRFGIQMVASPRHADGLLVTGCVTENMRLALEKAYAATASPKIVIAVGACAISGGPFFQNPQQLLGASSVVPVDLFIPGCPPHPLTILDGLLRLLGRIEEGPE